MSLSGVTKAIGATTAVVGAAKTLASTSPATALSGITSAVSGAIGSIGSFFKAMPNVTLPLPNPLFAYASYDYVLGMGVLTDSDLNNPDSTYRAGKRIPLIAKSANADPNNRITTPYGKFDFFIDNVVMTSSIGHEKGNNTNVTTMSFEIVEPYSMGMFMVACQAAAYQAKHKNWRDAPFVLTVDFRGNTETGTIANIPNTSRQIPFKFADISMKVTGSGSVYSCNVMIWNQAALATKYANLKSDTSIQGKTVQEVLQTGEKSLQAVVNQRLYQLKKDGIVKVPDEIIILFPENVASSASPASKEEPTENKQGATATSNTTVSEDVFKKLGVTRSTKNQTLVQPEGQGNALGKAQMNFNVAKKGDAPIGKDNVVYDPKTKVNVRANNTINFQESDFRFRQDTDIPNAINQVLLQSQFPGQTFDPSNLTKEGYRQWWRIDTQVYNITTDENLTSTGRKPKIIVYRVVPYNVHASRVTTTNSKAPGFEELRKQAVKHYNFLYTGKNVDVLKFEINYSGGFSALMAADNFNRTQDEKTKANTGSADQKDAKVEPLGSNKGNEPEKDQINTTQTEYAQTQTANERQGGSGGEDAGVRAARVFHDAITKSADMIELNMDIIGDPYWIAQSGTGNYTAVPSDKQNLNTDGTVNWQNGEVDIIVNFRIPVDINQTSGLYDFGAGSSAPVVHFSGLYRVQVITSTFRQGKFTQNLSGFRRQGQELKSAGTPDKTYSSKNTKENSKEVYGSSEGE